jgi:hydroxyacylglutathione hydrolase
MVIEQFYDTGLAHASYAIINDSKAVIIDPSRNPEQYYEFCKKHNATIIAVIETHPHADFISGHLEISTKNGVPIYLSKLIQPEFDFIGFDDGDSIALGNVTLKSINTPGHSPDSICIVLIDENGVEHSVFTGDTLFIGDVGRPDLRESAGNITSKKEELAIAMYHSLRDKLMLLPDTCMVYPAHGAGSLCGKNLSSETVSTIGQQKLTNYALQEMSEADFVKILTTDQPFMPKYFGFDVELNKQGAPDYFSSVNKVKFIKPEQVNVNSIVIDCRPASDFRKGHVKNAVNLMMGGKFETWLGSIVGPEEEFYIIVTDKEQGEEIIDKISKIGYESMIIGVSTNLTTNLVSEDEIDLEHFDENPTEYTIVDIRNNGEFEEGPIFENVIHIPLPELRERVEEIPTSKPVMIHCAGGYRSAAGMSIVKQKANCPVFDLSDAIASYKERLAEKA